MRGVLACFPAWLAGVLGLAACGGGSNATTRLIAVSGSPNVVSIAPPAGLSARQAAAFRSGAIVVGQDGCLACHRIGTSGNDGPGPALTHEGARRSTIAIASALRNPRAPIPSLAALDRDAPQKFKNLVEFISLLR